VWRSVKHVRTAVLCFIFLTHPPLSAVTLCFPCLRSFTLLTLSSPLFRDNNPLYSSFLFCKRYFYWLPEPSNKETPEKPIHHNYRSPMMAGGLFAMGREFFLASGAYDEDQDTWGGENFEMSFRLWMCGGELITVPCSHIAHAFRKKTPYKFKNRDPLKTIAHNLNRVAAVWLDQYAQFYHNMSGNLIKSPSFGDVSGRLALRERLKCKSFQWCGATLPCCTAALSSYVLMNLTCLLVAQA
jgi:hypothetical protein